MANREHCPPSCSRKRKHSNDEDENDILIKEGLRHLKQSFGNEYEHLDDGDDDCVVENDDDDQLGKVFEVQEKATIKEYDGIKITPFNLDEEREEGDFDRAGNFIFKGNENVDIDSDDEDEKDEDAEHDTWADSIDWSAVEKEEKEKKEQELIRKHTTINDNKKNKQISTVQQPKRTKIDCYKHLLRLVRPDETVQKSLRRLGNTIPKRQPNQLCRRKSNQTTPMDTIVSSEEINEAKRKLDLLIELAHQVLEEGDTDIYQKTYEQLEEAIN